MRQLNWRKLAQPLFAVSVAVGFFTNRAAAQQAVHTLLKPQAVVPQVLRQFVISDKELIGGLTGLCRRYGVTYRGGNVKADQQRLIVSAVYEGLRQLRAVAVQTSGIGSGSTLPTFSFS